MATEGPLDLSGLDLGGGGPDTSPEGDDDTAMAEEMESEAKLMHARRILKILDLPASKAADFRDALSAFMRSGSADMED